MMTTALPQSIGFATAAMTKAILLYAFGLMELNVDVGRDRLEGRKAILEIILARLGGVRFNEHMAGDGETVFRHACKLGP